MEAVKVLAAGCAAALVGGMATGNGAVALGPGEGYRQDFDDLDGLLPPHWLADRCGSPALPAGEVCDGSLNRGDLYLFGSDSQETALGSLASGSASTIRFGVVLQNTADDCVTECEFGFEGEQWRSGATLATNRLECRYAVLTAPPTNLAQIVDWHSCPAGNFTSMYHGARCALDGNQASNRVVCQARQLLARVLPPGHFLALWWMHADGPGEDHGLAIDNFWLRWTALSPPEPVHRLLAFWHCNDTEGETTLKSLRPLGTTETPCAYFCDFGAMTNAALAVWEGLVGQNGGVASQNFGAYGGSTLNWPTIEGTNPVAGSALAVLGQENNQGFFEMVFDRAVTDCRVSYATSGTGTGFTNHTVWASTNAGLDWMARESLPAENSGGSSFSLRTLDLTDFFAGSYGTERNRIRVILDGATSYSGNNRFDNLALEGAFPLAYCRLLGTPDAVADLNGAGWHEVGEPLGVRAAPCKPGWRFLQWSDGCRDAERVVTLPPDGMTLTATFVPEGTLLTLR